AAFDTHGWDLVLPREVDVAVVRPVAPPVRRVAELRPVAVTRAPDGAQVVDLGQNVNGWVRLTDLGPAGTELTLRYGEHLDRDGDLDTAHLDVDLPIVPAPLPLGQVDSVVSAGLPDDVFEPRMTTHGFRYVRVEGHPAALAERDVTGVVVHSDLRPTGTFACSDRRLEALHDAAVWSLRGNVCGIPTDCPQRERAGWTGDWQVFAPTAAFLYDVLGFTRSWLRDVALDQRGDGCVANLSPCPPSEGFGGPLAHLNGSAGWGDVVVSAPWHLYEAYGDTSILEEGWPAMTAWVDHAARAAAGSRHPDRVARRPVPAEHEQYLWDTGFHWGEWMEPGAEITDFGAFAGADKSEVATAYLHRSAQTVADVARVLGEDDATVGRYQQLADGARRAWRAEHLRPDGTLVVRTQAAHVRALAFGLVPEADRAAVADALAALVEEAGDHLTTGFLSTGLLLPVLAEHGHLDTAYRVLLQDSEPSWLTMLDRGATTLWERWDGVDAQGRARDSLNHYSKGAVVSFLHQHVAGLRMTSPGYRTFRVRPRPGGGLSGARATHESPYSRIATGWTRRDGRLEVSVEVPPGTSAEVVLPDGTAHRAGPGAWSFDGPA
ncbi:MAG: family 78 glycoside hydrolase catalytic domain, partial [Marmoricola sp.]|nr:family 78 glycoside hydrolase catalytic domain [Marmoricola sp.]